MAEQTLRRQGKETPFSNVALHESAVNPSAIGQYETNFTASYASALDV